jgi:hypothetical protein
VIRFDHDRVTSLQFFADQLSDVSEVGQCGDADTAALCGEAEVVDRIMRYGKWLEIDVADAKLTIRIDRDLSILQSVATFGRFIAVPIRGASPVISHLGLGGNVHLAINAPEQIQQSAHLIAVIVRDDYAVHLDGSDANGIQPSYHFARTKADIN